MAAPQHRLLRGKRFDEFSGFLTPPIVDKRAIPFELFFVYAKLAFPFGIEKVGPVPGTILFGDHRGVVSHDEVSRIDRREKFFLVFGRSGVACRFGRIVWLQQVLRFQQTHFHAADAQHIREILVRSSFSEDALP